MKKPDDQYCRNYETMPSPDQNLTFEQARKVFDEYGIPFIPDSMVRVDGPFYTNVARIVSDQNPYSIKAAVFRSEDTRDYVDRKIFTGSAYKQLEEILKFLDIYNHVASEIHGLVRQDFPDYDPAVLREALINGIVHRDYSKSASMLINFFPDRIEIISQGGISGHLKAGEIVNGISARRNPKLADSFRCLNWTSTNKTGLQRIFRDYESFNQKPEIRATENSFALVLPNKNVLRNAISNKSL